MDTPTGVDSSSAATEPAPAEAAAEQPTGAPPIEAAPAPSTDRGDDEEYIPKWKAKELIESRQKAKRERDQANSKVAEFEAARDASRRQEMELKGEYERLVEEAKAEKETILADRAKELRDRKFEKLMHGVMASAGLDDSDEYAVRALLESIEKDYGDLDKDRPVDKKAVETAGRRMRERAPRLFTVAPTGGEKPPEGISKAAPEKSEDAVDDRVLAVRAAAKALSQVVAK